MADQRTTATKRSAAAKKAAATRQELAKTGYAERAVLIPLGAVLTARDVAMATVEGAEKGLAAHLERFEHRGRTERTRVERELRARRQEVATRAGAVTTRVESLVQRLANVG
jgi:hypothetical protein